MKKRYIALIVIFLAFFMLGCAGNSNHSNTATSSDNSQKQPLQVNEKVKPVIIASWNGESTKNTETFFIPSDEWKISWDTKAGQYGAMNFQIYVYNKDGTIKGVVANVIGDNQDSTIMRGSGDYYLMINTAQPYDITVESM